MDGATINVNESIKQWENIGWERLHDSFYDALNQALRILYNKTLVNLKGTGVNVTSPVKAHGYTYNPLITGVVQEVADTALQGRVRIGAGSKEGGYRSPKRSHFMLKWYEQGAGWKSPNGLRRTKKSFDITKHTKTGKTYVRHVKAGKNRGAISGKDYFKNAINQSMEAVQDRLSELILKAIENNFGA